MTGTHPLRAKRRRAALRTAAFMSPWLIGSSLFFAYPLLSTVYFSFTKYDGFRPPVFNGADNWTYVFTDYPLFWPAMWNTLWLVVVMVSCRVLFGLGVGLLITKIKSGAGLFRTLFYLPYLAPPVAATLAFVFLLNPGTGPVNVLLDWAGLPAPGWFTDADWSKPALTALALWGVGDLMVIFMAALLDVPREQYEAAELDGAGAWARLRHITLPNISPIILFAVVTGGHPGHAVLHAAAGGGEGVGRRHRRLGPAVRARLPGQVHADAAPDHLQRRLPALRLRRRLRRRAGALRPLHGLHRAPDAPPWRTDRSR
ncbi:hypothetical protein GCM10020254_54760 [Streptomyces goshikiensis]